MAYYSTCEVYTHCPIHEVTCSSQSKVFSAASAAVSYLEGMETALAMMLEAGLIVAFDLDLHYTNEWRSDNV